jgi:hypothetical protein
MLRNKVRISTQRTQRKTREKIGAAIRGIKEKKRFISSFLRALGVYSFGFYAEDFTGSPATTDRYTSLTCSADRSHEYFWTSS